MTRDGPHVRPLRSLLLALAVLLLAPPAAMADRWTIVVESLAPVREQTSQPLSPPAVVIHDGSVDVWQLGRYASRGVWSIAEDGNVVPLLDRWRGRRGVGAAAAPVAGLFPGERREFTLRRVPRRHDRITILEMLGNTNDGFTGLDGVRVARGRRVQLETIAYDAGSERNSELRQFIPGPCCGSLFSRDPERRRIRRHRGITGHGDLDPAIQGWSGPIARYTIRRRR